MIFVGESALDLSDVHLLSFSLANNNFPTLALYAPHFFLKAYVRVAYASLPDIFFPSMRLARRCGSMTREALRESSLCELKCASYFQSSNISAVCAWFANGVFI
jgi:hypothetical protein